MGEIGESALDDFAVDAAGLAEEDGGRGATEAPTAEE
jgi:hypothetical protein